MQSDFFPNRNKVIGPGELDRMTPCELWSKPPQLRVSR